MNTNEEADNYIIMIAGLLLTAVICLSFFGCSAAMTALAAHQVLDNWSNWFSGDEDKATNYTVFVNGYDLGKSASATGLVNLKGIPTGRDYLVTVAKVPKMKRGLHAVVNLDPDGRIDLRNRNLFEGRVIKGTVRRNNSNGEKLSNVRVVALRDGASKLANGSAPLHIPPDDSGELDYMMGYTNGDGEYRLGPAWYDDWLVTATLAGHNADVRAVQVSSNSNGIANLVLDEVTDADTGTATGTVSEQQSGNRLDHPLVTAFLDTPFTPDIPADARNDVATQRGLQMPETPWFEFDTLSKTGSENGQYSLQLPPGTHELQAYKYPHDAASEELTFSAGSAQTHNFTLN